MHTSKFPCSYDVLLLILCLAAYSGQTPVDSIQEEFVNFVPVKWLLELLKVPVEN